VLLFATTYFTDQVYQRKEKGQRQG